MNRSNVLIVIDLSKKTVEKEIINDEVIDGFLGGRGMNAYLLSKFIENKIDPLSPENVLVISCGILTGSRALSSARVQVSAVSPVSNFIGTSNVGGFFGAEMAKEGILSIVIKGKSEKPVYIHFENSDVQIKSAEHIWGENVRESIEAIKSECESPKDRIAVIGPAGEGLVRYANVMFGEDSAAGRTGMGAVFGSKNLKAVAFGSNKKVETDISKDMSKAIKRHLKSIKEHSEYERWSKYADSTDVVWLNDFGASPAYNYSKTNFDDVEKASGYMFKDCKTKYSSCYMCPIHCKGTVELDRGRHIGFKGHRPPFECIAAFGVKCGNNDAFEALYLHTKCNEWGMDSMEAGSSIAFAMDLYNRKILTDSDTNGLKLKWGNTEVMDKLLEEIAFRSTWLGEVLGEGLRSAAAKIGRGGEKYAYHVKGLSMPAMDPRGFKGTGLGMAVSSRGADFTNAYPSLECGYESRTKDLAIFDGKEVGDRLSTLGKGEMVKFTYSVSALIDSLGLCKIAYLSLLNDFTLDVVTELLNGIVDMDFSVEGLYRCGERVVNLERLFNISQGLERKDDKLPDKFLKEPIAEGICKGHVVELEKMVDEFYKIMGWSHEGIPGQDKIKELGLDRKNNS